MTETKKRPRGRPSKEEELRQFAEFIGAEPELVGDYIGAALPAPPKIEKPPPPVDPSVPPENWADWEAEMMRILWVNRYELKGVALVQLAKAIRDLAEHQRARQTDDESQEVSILDRIDALPKEHALGLIRQEQARLEEEYKALVEAEQRLEAAE